MKYNTQILNIEQNNIKEQQKHVCIGNILSYLTLPA